MPKLVFCSSNPDYVPLDVASVVSGLQQAGFLGKQWQSSKSGGECYLIGDSFLSQVTFLGCAPSIELAPLKDDPTSTEFCHIEFEPLHEQVTFIRGSEHIISRCPFCRRRDAEWNSVPKNMLRKCEQCKKEIHLAEFDWRNTAGCARFFISLHGIYPQEAIPTSALLQTFEQITGEKWNYFYIH